MVIRVTCDYCEGIFKRESSVLERKLHIPKHLVRFIPYFEKEGFRVFSWENDMGKQYRLSW